MTNKSEWGTSNLALAATVKCMGAKYSRTDKTNSRSMVFYFTIPEDASGLDKILGEFKFKFDEVERDFTNDNLKVSPKSFYQSLQDLKSIIHSK